jgi:hypothetical protein
MYQAVDRLRWQASGASVMSTKPVMSLNRRVGRRPSRRDSGSRARSAPSGRDEPGPGARRDGPGACPRRSAGRRPRAGGERGAHPDLGVVGMRRDCEDRHGLGGDPSASLLEERRRGRGEPFRVGGLRQELRRSRPAWRRQCGRTSRAHSARRPAAPGTSYGRWRSAPARRRPRAARCR